MGVARACPLAYGREESSRKAAPAGAVRPARSGLAGCRRRCRHKLCASGTPSRPFTAPVGRGRGREGGTAGKAAAEGVPFALAAIRRPWRGRVVSRSRAGTPPCPSQAVRSRDQGGNREGLGLAERKRPRGGKAGLKAGRGCPLRSRSDPAAMALPSRQPVTRRSPALPLHRLFASVFKGPSEPLEAGIKRQARESGRGAQAGAPGCGERQPEKRAIDAAAFFLRGSSGFSGPFAAAFASPSKVLRSRETDGEQDFGGCLRARAPAREALAAGRGGGKKRGARRAVIWAGR